MDYRIMLRVFISVVLYTSAFVHAPLFYGAVFICCIPLFVVILTLTRVQLPYVVLWAVLLMALQWWPLITIIFKQGNHPLKYCIPIVCLLLVAAGGLIAGVLSIFINRYIHSLYMRVLALSFVWWLFIEWIYRYLCISFGYTLCYPLIPLAMQPMLLKVSAYVPMAFLCFCLALGQMAVAAYYCYGNKRLLIIALFCYVSFGIGLIVPPHTPQASLNACGGTPPLHSAAMLDNAQEIAKCIIGAPDYDYVIFPESSFCYDCQSDPAILEMWQMHMQDQQRVIMGTHVMQDKQWCVAACCLTQHNVVWHYKSLLLPFAEYVPTWAPEHFKKIFLHEHESFIPAHHARALDNDNDFDLLICAEFFLSKECWQQMAERKRPLIVLASDSWCSKSYLPDLLLLFARFKAIEWGRVIIYRSYMRFCIIDEEQTT